MSRGNKTATLSLLDFFEHDEYPLWMEEFLDRTPIEIHFDWYQAEKTRNYPGHCEIEVTCIKASIGEVEIELPKEMQDGIAEAFADDPGNFTGE